MTDNSVDIATLSNARRWSILLTSMVAAIATTVTTTGTAYLIPAMHADGASLSTAATIAALPTMGLMLGVIAWGYAIDRFGERVVLLISGTLTAALSLSACVTHGLGAPLSAVGALLLLAGLSCGAANGASGRLVVGWFPPRNRGTAMGIRQTSQPLAIALCSLTMPVIAQKFSLTAALAVPTVVATVALVGVAVAVIDPPRPPRAPDGQRPSSPYRQGTFLAQVHAVSVLLVIPQSLLWTFTPTWLIVVHQWSPAAAGGVITVGQFLGAAGRIAAGRWSDLWASRTRCQFVTTATLAPTVGAAIVPLGFPAIFALAAAAPAAAVLLVPRDRAPAVPTD